MTRWPAIACSAAAGLCLAGALAHAQEMKKGGQEKPDKREPNPLKQAEEAETQERGGLSGQWGRLLEDVELMGYVEAHYNNPELGTMSRGAPARFDLHRLVFGLEYAFTDLLKFEIEVEFEHAGDAIEIEEVILEYQVLPELAFQAGGLLLPVGLVNPDHKPTRFYSVERPTVDRVLVPSTWMEPGAGIVAQLPDDGLFGWFYVVGGLEAAGFTSLDGIRGGRGGGRESKGDDLAVVARVEYWPLQDPRLSFAGTSAPPDPALFLGVSFYVGDADQAVAALSGVQVTLAEADVRFQALGFDLRGQFVHTRVAHAEKASLFSGQTVGEQIQGWYAEAAYHLYWLLFPEDVADLADDLVLFARHEDLDTNKMVDEGFSRNDLADREIWTFGVAYSPIPKVVLKADVERWRDGTGDRMVRYNLGFGLVF